MAFVRFSMVNQYNVTVAGMTAPANVDGIEGPTDAESNINRAPNGKRAGEEIRLAITAGNTSFDATAPQSRPYRRTRAITVR
jgi:hypothetical protein